MAILPQYNTPTAPTPNPTGSSLPLIGPYQQQQAMAQQAYEQALSNISTKRAQTMQQYGYMPTAGGGMAVDPSNPFGQYQQTALGNANEAEQVQNAQVARGFAGPGLGHQAENSAHLAEQGRMASLAQALAGNLGDLSQQGQQAQFDLSNASTQNQLQSVEYAIQNHLFANGAPMLDQSTVDQRIQQMAKAWAQHWGASGKNVKGKTFQQMLDAIGASNLYDPNAHYGIAKVNF